MAINPVQFSHAVCDEFLRYLFSAFPLADPALLLSDTAEYPVQVNGKVRDRIEVAAGLSEEELLAAARASERVQAYLGDGDPRKVVVVPDRLVNIVV